MRNWVHKALRSSLRSGEGLRIRLEHRYVGLDGFVKHTETAIKPRKKVREGKARELMAAYYQKHRASLPENVRQHRELIVELIMEGFSEEEAFAQSQRVAA